MDALDDDDTLGFQIDSLGDQSLRAAPNARRSARSKLAKLKTKYVASEEEIAAATESYQVSGSSSDLKKEYYRLTSTAKAEDVRSESILKDALQAVLRQWKGGKDWLDVSGQLRSIRQDLAVQRIQNGFTVHVYEVNARLALEAGDLGQFNQCQAQRNSPPRRGCWHATFRCRGSKSKRDPM